MAGNRFSDSEPLPSVSGIPQGSILAPLLFSIHTNDLTSVPIKCMAKSYVDDTNLLILPELRTKNLTQIKLNSWLLEADRKLKELNWLPVEKKSVMYLRSATLAFKFMTGSVPDYLTSKFTKRFKISGRETRNSQSLHIPLFLKIGEWPEKRLLQNSEDIQLIG